MAVQRQIASPCLKIVERKTIVRVSPVDNLLANQVKAQRKALRQAIDGEKRNIVLDLSSVEKMDSLGLELVTGIFKSCQRKGLEFCVEGVNEDLMRMFSRSFDYSGTCKLHRVRPRTIRKNATRATKTKTLPGAVDKNRVRQAKKKIVSHSTKKKASPRSNKDISGHTSKVNSGSSRRGASQPDNNHVSYGRGRAIMSACLKIAEKKTMIRVSPADDLLAGEVEAQQKALTKVIDGEKRKIVLDLSSVEQVDSLGINLVIGLFKSCEQNSLEFRVEGVNEKLMKVFLLFKLQDSFQIKGA